MDPGRPRLVQHARWSGSLLGPGAALEGAATVADRGGAGGRLWLSVVVGCTRPRLARSLRLVVDAVDPGGRTRPLYSGSLPDFGSRPVGSLTPGASRRVRLRLSWPAALGDPRPADARLTARLRWTLA